MLYTGIDYHRRYSVLRTVDDAGNRVKAARIEHDDGNGFAPYFKNLPEPSRVVMEACWNWGWLYDLLGETAGVQEVTLAHPFKTRLIADAQIKTDGLDAQALATLLRCNLVAKVHAPNPAMRSRKHVLRQRMFWVGVRTRVRNRIHTVVARQRKLAQPIFSDLFGKKGLHWLKGLHLPAPDGDLLAQDLRTLELLGLLVGELEKRIRADNAADPAVQRLLTIPGLGPILAAVIATEIDGIDRFRRAPKLCAYAGLVPTTHSSGGKTAHGGMMPFANRWLKWAFVEASWVAVGCSPYFGTLYRQHRARGKQANTAITAVARRMCTIAWELLTQKRDFSANPPHISSSPVAPPKD